LARRAFGSEAFRIEHEIASPNAMPKFYQVNITPILNTEGKAVVVAIVARIRVLALEIRAMRLRRHPACRLARKMRNIFLRRMDVGAGIDASCALHQMRKRSSASLLPMSPTATFRRTRQMEIHQSRRPE
jgi:hypothetical protein